MTLPVPSPRRTVSRFTVLGALVALTGCGGGETKVMSLAELSDRSLTFALADVDDAETPDAQGAHRVTVSYSVADGPCSRFADDVTATLNGQPMTLVPGGASDVGGRSEACENSRVYFNFDPAAWGREPVEDIVVQLQDATSTVRLVVQNAKAKRKFTFQGEGTPDKLRVGQSYDFLWEPSTEVPGPVEALLLREGGRAPGELPVTQDGNKVTVSIPAATPQANHTLTLGADLTGAVTECTGVASCTGAIFHSQDFVLSVVP
ncbi:putative lipoprotein [Corallococcus coralloides DSM 2259]|uniref:Putative lipoprotein n=1 Tax=Corallococcus coralloides (strain ATCC 25202 / DSM 2259 / NBRC 100086 / M2) TaxID=1144275 RepID=H8MLL8_CORCM|nr:hypothetical protein [Corallococcus coralloides]AFE03829.1 putative lipoprotein [Corallococcus coralloides DSM 2259]